MKKIKLWALICLTSLLIGCQRQVHLENDGQDIVTEERIQNLPQHTVVKDSDWNGPHISWLLSSLVNHHLDIDFQAINRYLQKLDAPYRIQAIILELGKDSSNPGQEYFEKASPLLQAYPIDLIHFGFYNPMTERGRPLIDKLVADKALLNLQDINLTWAPYTSIGEEVICSGEPNLVPIGLFIPEENVTDTFQDLSLSDILASNQIEIRSPASNLLINQRIYEDLFIYEEETFKLWWESKSYYKIRNTINNRPTPFEEAKAYLIPYNELSIWQGQEAEYQGVKGIYLLKGLSYHSYSFSRLDNYETGILETSHNPDYAKDFLKRLDQDPNLISILADSNPPISNLRTFFNQWALTEKVTPELLADTLPKNITYFDWVVNRKELQPIKEIISNHPAYQEIEIFQIPKQESYQSLMNSLKDAGIDLLLKDITDQYQNIKL